MGVATRKSVPTAPSVGLGNIPAEMTGMDPIRGAVAGAIGGAAGAYTMERFRAWWNNVAARVAKKVLDTELPEDMKPAAGEAVHYTTGATIGAIYGFVTEILPPARMFNGLLMGTIVWWTADNMAVLTQKLGKKPEQVRSIVRLVI